MASEPPARIGPYEILGELGRGGMGVVYRARRADLGRDFALKVILPGQETTAESLARFRREAQLAAGLAGHPGIVGVHDIGEAFVASDATNAQTDARPVLYIAMDLVDGPSLDKLLDAGEITPERAARLVEQTARALHAAHARGILHRDVKPGNILVGPDGEPRLTDFGLAKSRETGPEAARLTKSGAVLGTPSYMAPEQAEGRGLDARADVYALGVTLYELLVGEPPFQGDTLYSVLARVLKEEPKPPRQRDPRVPRDLETIVLKCLEKDPARRYDSAAALADDLGRFRQGEAILAHPPSAWYRFRKRCARHRGPLLAAGVGLAGVTAVAVAFGWRVAGERVQRTQAEADNRRARADAVEQLGRRTGLALAAALELRRVAAYGRMRGFAEETTRACAEARAVLPGDPHPDWCVGRMARACMDDAAAVLAVDAALAADPAFVPARYERAMRDARAWREALRTAAGDGALPVPPRLAAPDPAGTALAARLRADLAAVRARPEAMPRPEGATPGALPPEPEVATALAAFLDGDLVGALATLEPVAARAPACDEAREWRAELLEWAGRPADALAAWDAAVAGDAGFAPHRLGRARLRLALARTARAAGQDPAPHLAAARADCDAATAAVPALAARADTLRAVLADLGG